MSIAVITIVLLVTLPALWLGGRNVRTWDSKQDPHAPRDISGELTVMVLRVGALLLLVASAAVAVVGAFAAYHGDAELPGGVIFAAVFAVLLAALIVGLFGRKAPSAIR